MAFGSNRRAQEADIHILLSDEHRKHMCSEAFVNDLCDRVEGPAMAELDRLFGPGWALELQPSLVLEGPGLAFRITITQIKGWSLNAMVGEISRVFNTRWEQEVDRIPPR